jgi:hypothetical protein
VVTQVDSIQFSCSGCGKLVRARVDQGGRAYPCPGCGAVVNVPKIALATRSAPAPQPTPPPGTRVHEHGHVIEQQPPRQLPGWLRVPTTIGELIGYIGAAWLAASLLLLCF